MSPLTMQADRHASSSIMTWQPRCCHAGSANEMCCRVYLGCIILALLKICCSRCNRLGIWLHNNERHRFSKQHLTAESPCLASYPRAMGILMPRSISKGCNNYKKATGPAVFRIHVANQPQSPGEDSMIAHTDLTVPKLSASSGQYEHNSF